MFDLEGVFAAQIAAEVFQLGRQRGVFVLQAILVETADALVEVDTHEEPIVAGLGAGLHAQDFYVIDFH